MADVAKLPQYEMFGSTASVNDEIVISILATVFDYEKISKRARGGKKAILAITPDMAEGEAMQFDVNKAVTIEQARTGIQKHHANAFIINELF